ncbi:hypothetical protein HNP55_000708 [Paucibacter oligotrophus]|uniref:Replication-associated protein ORF2/G2P domain-containing protein n=1 Tax=Roseateles oligotrophus TaxID=1769250 RepID=A0A840L5W2_9BURK|nr:hypothetical protein [Roseateles oligotrophus]MBB4842213.1 hypothetical protein [Roseateles oligotrophus]
MRLHDLGHGHKEVVISRPTIWVEMDPDHAAMFGDDWAAADARERERTRKLREEANRERAARRAKTRVRRMVKVMGLDALLTLTYRANQTDQELCKRHMKEFVRRMRRLIPGFQYVAAFETQKRGAWHVHMAMHALPHVLAWRGVKVKSFSVVRAVWRSVVGDLGGNIDQQRRKRFSRQSSGKLAAYLSKYMLKAFQDGDDWSNRYSASAGGAVPEAAVLRFRAATMAELIGLAFDEAASGACECMTWLSRWGDTFFLSTEAENVGATSPPG